DDLFHICNEENTTLSALTARIEAAVLCCKHLRPKIFTIKELNAEHICMAMIRALPSEFQSFRSALLLLDSLNVSSLCLSVHVKPGSPALEGGSAPLPL
ncbi:hypothetical protein FA95DRAFT_1636652, partial [Auriscalpium vulgare]